MIHDSVSSTHPVLSVASFGAVLLDTAGILTAIDSGVTIFAAAIAAIWFGRYWTQRHRGFVAPSPVRPNRFDPNVVLAAVAVYLLSAATLATWFASTHREVWAAVWVDTGGRLAGTAVCIYAAATRYAGGLRAFFAGSGEPSAAAKARIALAVGIVALGLCPVVRDVTMWVVDLVAPGFIPQAHPTIVRLHEEGADPAAVAALWVSAAVVAPVAEEIFFRGVFQTILMNLLRHRGWAILGSALAFGAVHVAQPQALPALFVMGLLLGLAYERTGGVTVPIAIHAAFNLKTLVWFTLAGADGAAP